MLNTCELPMFDVCADHEVPPFVVFRMFPPVPTTQHVFASAHAMSCTVNEVPPVVCVANEVPPFVVFRMTALAAVANQHVFASTHAMPLIVFVVPLVTDDHVVPPSVVFRIVPEAPAE